MKHLHVLLAVGLCIAPCSTKPWGTLTAPMLTPAQREELEDTVRSAGTRGDDQVDEIALREGPFPVHQFIVRQAFLLLQKDPAYSAEESGFPSVDDVLRWDGVRQSPSGMAPAGQTATSSERFAPRGGVQGPSADSELMALGGPPNFMYNGGYHYWNPFLQNGTAPEGAGEVYASLVDAVARKEARGAPCFASYLGHYVSDVCTPKHADAIILGENDVAAINRISIRWRRKEPSTAAGVREWLRNEDVQEVLRILRRAAASTPGAANADAYWRRLDRHIADTPVFRTGVTGQFEFFPRTVESAVAAYMRSFGQDTRDRNKFHCFFDPFYFNGPVFIHTLTWVDFRLATPLGGHLLWETSPGLRRFIDARDGEAAEASILGGDFNKAQRPLGAWQDDLMSNDPAKVTAAQKNRMAELVRRASLEVHGSDPSNERDFGADFEGPMKTAIQYVYSAFRATLTALRPTARFRFVDEGRTLRVQCEVESVADDFAKIKGIRVWRQLASGEPETFPEWTQKITSGVGVSTGTKPAIVTANLRLPDGKSFDPNESYLVDVFAEFEKIPDRGWARTRAERSGVTTVHDPTTAEEVTSTKGPLDLVIVFDITGSMSSSINSVRDNVKLIVGRLLMQTGDMRLAMIGYRDLEDKEAPAITVNGFSTNIAGQLAIMNSWKARGGGDVPEDQLYAIRQALNLWVKEGTTTRMATKVIVVVTDASAKPKDRYGNSPATVAQLAEDVDPAHVYPIVVGSDPGALASAQEIASLTGGSVLRASDGSKVGDVLLDAVSTAMARHAPRGNPWVGWAFYGGSALIGLGIIAHLLRRN